MTSSHFLTTTMIQSLLTDIARFSNLSPGFAQAADWLLHNDPSDVLPGKYEIGGGVFVNSEEPELRPPSDAFLEAHRRYADIHVPISGTERVGLAYTSTLSHPVGEYDADRDIQFFTDSYSQTTEIRPGELLIVFPEDAHAPNIGTGAHRKLCIKIPL